MDQGTERWQILGDNYVPPLWRLYFSARIIIWQCCQCFSKGPYDFTIISAWSVIVYVRVQVSHIVWQPTRLASLRITSPHCACAGKIRWLTRQGEIVGSTRLMTQRACHWIKTSEWHIPAEWWSKNRLVTSDQILFKWHWRCWFR